MFINTCSLVYQYKCSSMSSVLFIDIQNKCLAINTNMCAMFINIKYSPFFSTFINILFEVFINTKCSSIFKCSSDCSPFFIFIYLFILKLMFIDVYRNLSLREIGKEKRRKKKRHMLLSASGDILEGINFLFNHLAYYLF